MINVERNDWTGGYKTVFKHNGEMFYADLSPTGGLNECMIFRVNVNGSIEFGNELYTRRHIPVTSANLLNCISEFIDNNKEDD